jgi:hypothetical protein
MLGVMVGSSLLTTVNPVHSIGVSGNNELVSRDTIAATLSTIFPWVIALFFECDDSWAKVSCQVRSQSEDRVYHKDVSRPV